MTIKQKKQVIDIERINPELRDKVMFIPAKRQAEIEEFFGGDLMALRDITKLVHQNTIETED